MLARIVAASTLNLRQPRWNLSSRVPDFLAADGFVVSIPKSGRTWVRCFLLSYFASQRRASQSGASFQTPNLLYTHDRWDGTAKLRLGERLRGKWLIPGRAARRKPILLVARDPRDTLVSLFFQLHKRKGIIQDDLPAMLRHPIYGVRRMVRVMNHWMHEWGASERLHLLRYEKARRDPQTEFRAALEFLLPEGQLDAEAFERALEISSFDNMRRLESGDHTGAGADIVQTINRERKKLLSPANLAEPDSMKVRRGVVGGYAEYFSPADNQFIWLELKQ